VLSPLFSLPLFSHCWELHDESFAFSGRIGTACVDLLNRVLNTHLIDFLLRATKQERKSALKIEVETFKYLGVVFTSDGSRNKSIDTRIGKANAVLRRGGSNQ